MEIEPTEESPVSLLLTSRAYKDLCSYVLQEYGLDLSTLAEQDPAKAWQLIIDEFAALAQSVQWADVGGRRVTRKKDGHEAYEGFAQWAVQQLSPDSDVTAFDVAVQTPKSFFRREASLLVGRTGLKTVLSFRVEPPNLAS